MREESRGKQTPEAAAQDKSKSVFAVVEGAEEHNEGEEQSEPSNDDKGDEMSKSANNYPGAASIATVLADIPVDTIAGHPIHKLQHMQEQELRKALKLDQAKRQKVETEIKKHLETDIGNCTSSTEKLQMSSSPATTLAEEKKPEEARNQEAEQTGEEQEQTEGEAKKEFFPPSGLGAITRWGWWILIAYMFFAQTTVCDEWFVPAIEVISEKFNIPEDVSSFGLIQYLD